MKCSKCGKNFQVTHTYATKGGKTQRLVCKGCGIVGTVVSIIVNTEPDREDGAYSLAKRLKNGKAAVIFVN